jgi:SAM-dependent methyltransferase
VEFFEERARRVEHLGPLRAVIYQDKHPDLAERRDEAEKEKLLPILKLAPSLRLLDVGCGTGRWADTVVPLVAAYHGIDISPGLVVMRGNGSKVWTPADSPWRLPPTSLSRSWVNPCRSTSFSVRAC